MLQGADTRAWSTTELTESFGWKQGQGGNQQDIHELNRVLIDAIDQALSDTPYESLVRELFFGQQTTVIKCLECGNSRGRPDPFLELQLAVKNMKNVEQSLEQQF